MNSSYGQDGPLKQAKKLEKAAYLDPDTAKQVPAPPLPLADISGDSKLAHLRLQLAKVHQNHVKFIEDVKDGNALPFAGLKNELPKIQKKLTELKSMVRLIKQEDNPKKRAELSLPLYAGIQPIGRYLDVADYAPFDNKLSKQQIAEAKDLADDVKIPSALSDAKHPVTLLTPSASYTITGLTVPIRIKTSPKTVIYLESTAGGQFENGLNSQKITADENGLVSTYWVTKGDASGDVPISISGPTCSSERIIEFRVVSLRPMPLPIWGNTKDRIAE